MLIVARQRLICISPFCLQIIKLQAGIKYGEEDIPGAQSLVEQCPADDPDTEINFACLLYKV